VVRLLSSRFDKLFQSSPSTSDQVESDPIRILTTDTEFYSLTRQMNRFMELPKSCFDILVVEAQPAASLLARIARKLRGGDSSEGELNSSLRVDMVYVSQITYTQQLLIPNIRQFVESLRSVLGPNNGTIVIDGYHGCGAVPTSLAGVDAVYVAGMLKHMSSSDNMAFAVLPTSVHSTCRPMLTGWLADLSVLGGTSPGISMGSAVNFTPGYQLMGSTPSFHTTLLTFNAVMDVWAKHGMSVDFAHEHVMQLQEAFLGGLQEYEASASTVGNDLPSTGKPTGHKVINSSTLSSWSRHDARASRSHTLVFVTQDPSEAAAAVAQFHALGIAIDSRKCFIRIGFGLNHSLQDVARLVDVVRLTSAVV
jgi:selenocysteine lyase/cysteine desulfurase